MGKKNPDRELVRQAAEGVIQAAKELQGAVREDDISRIWASNDRLRSRADTLKTELAVLHRLTPKQLA
jgi:hypothetical protein